jgi:DNA-binding CsgD family transcriptional regulator
MTKKPDKTVLTPREAQVASLMAAGLSKWDIAAQLGLSVSTIENHQASIRKRGLSRKEK